MELPIGKTFIYYLANYIRYFFVSWFGVSLYISILLVCLFSFLVMGQIFENVLNGTLFLLPFLYVIFFYQFLGKVTQSLVNQPNMLAYKSWLLFFYVSAVILPVLVILFSGFVLWILYLFGGWGQFLIICLAVLILFACLVLNLYLRFRRSIQVLKSLIFV